MNRLCGFCQSPLKTFVSKGTPPTDYTVCEKNPCPFFTKSSLLDDCCPVLLYRVKPIYKSLPSCCQHDKSTTLLLSTTRDNFNRPFFKCDMKKYQDPCSYFQWADEDPNEITLALNYTRRGNLSQRPLPPPPPPAPRKKKMSFLPPVKRITRITSPPDEEPEKKMPKNKKGKKVYPPPQITVLQEGTIQDPGTPCTSQDIQSIEQLLEATRD